MPKVLLCKEVDRDFIYYTYSGKVYRVPSQELSSILKKLGINDYEDAVKRGTVRRVLPDDSELQGLREKFIQEQLNGDFIENLSSPFDDDSVCEDLFEQALDTYSKKGDLEIRFLRTKNDSENIVVNGHNVFQVEGRIFNLLLSKYQNLEPVEKFLNELSSKTKKILLEHINDLEFLEEFCQELYLIDFLEKDSKKFPCLNAINDSKDEAIIKNFFDAMINIENDHVGKYDSVVYKIGEYNARIYLNCHNEQVLAEFLELYIEECLKHGLNYNMKGVYQSSKSKNNDASILYTDVTELKLRIEIIEGILLKHPEWREYFMQPIYGADRFGTGFYGVCHHPCSFVGEGMTTFNDYYKNLMLSAIHCMLAKVLLDNGIIKPSDKLYSAAQALAKFDTDKIKGKEGSGLVYVAGNEVFLFKEYLNNPDILLKIKNLGYEVFRDYLYKAHAICKHLPKGIYRHIALDETLFGYLKNGEIDSKYFDNISFLNPSVLEKYIKARNNKSISPPLSSLLEKVDECLLCYRDNLIGIEDIIIDLRLISILIDRYLKNITLNPKFSKETLNFIKNRVDHIVRLTDAKKRSDLDSKKEKFKIELKKKIGDFLIIRSKIKISNPTLDALIQEQYDNMEFYYKHLNAIHEEQILVDIYNCNHGLSILEKSKNVKLYERKCEILRNDVEISKKMLATISKVKLASEKPIKREISIDKTSSTIEDSRKVETSSKKVPERKPFIEAKSNFTVEDIVTFLNKFKLFRGNVSSMIDDRYKNVLKNIFDTVGFYYSNQNLINDDILMRIGEIYNVLAQIEQEALNGKIQTFRLAALEFFTKVLNRITFPKRYNELFLKYKNLSYEISTKLDDKYKEVLRKISRNERSFSLHQDLIDEQVLKIVDAINIVCSKIALALAYGKDVTRYLELLLQLDKDLEIVARKASSVDYEDSTGKTR